MPSIDVSQETLELVDSIVRRWTEDRAETTRRHGVTTKPPDRAEVIEVLCYLELDRFDLHSKGLR